jgi:hypothetical protein
VLLKVSGAHVSQLSQLFLFLMASTEKAWLLAAEHRHSPAQPSLSQVESTHLNSLDQSSILGCSTAVQLMELDGNNKKKKKKT